MSMLSEDSVFRAQHSNWDRSIGEATRNGFTSSSHLISSPNCANPVENVATSFYYKSQQFNERRRSVSPLSPPPIVEHHFEPQLPPRRPSGTFEYGYTYGSSSYRHDQSTFLGSPRLHTRYHPDHTAHRQINRTSHENRRRQFSPFMQSQKFLDKCESDPSNERFLSSSHLRPPHPVDVFRDREFPVNHDWDKSSNVLQEQVSPTVYLACALVIWSVDGYYGFLCDKNTPYGNLHFYADSSTVVKDEDNKKLGELPGDRVLRGLRVEIEAEFIEPDVSDPEIHHLIYVKRLAKLGTEISMHAVRTEVLVPLTKKKPAPYFKALSESGDLVYVHPSILLATSFIDSMKHRLSSLRPQYVEDMLHVLCSNRTIRGEVTIAPRWLSDAIGRTCNFKRLLISCEPYGDVLHGYGTVTEVVTDISITIKSQTNNDFIYCSLLSVSPESKVPYKVGVNVRYTACLDLPNSTYKWRCLGIARTSRIDISDTHSQTPLEVGDSGCVCNENTHRSLFKQLFGREEHEHLIDLQGGSASKKKSSSGETDLRLVDIPCEEVKSDGDIRSMLTILKIDGDLNAPSGVNPSAVADEEIPLCLNEIPRSTFKYGDEPHCHFTITDDVERYHYMNFSPLYKSMEDFLLKRKRRKEKNLRKALRKGLASKTRLESDESEHHDDSAPPILNLETKTDSEISTTRFQVVGIGDDIEKIFASPNDCFHTDEKSIAPQYPDGWWYRRTSRRLHPTVFVAEFIENRDVEKDCNENVNVTRLKQSLTIRNSGIFADDGLPVQCSVKTKRNETDSHLIINKSMKNEQSIMSLLRNDEVIGNFFFPLLKNLPVSLSKKHN